MFLDHTRNPEIFEEAEEFLASNSSGLLDVNGVAKYIQLYIQPPSPNPPPFVFINHRSDRHGSDGYIEGRPFWICMMHLVPLPFVNSNPC